MLNTQDELKKLIDAYLVDIEKFNTKKICMAGRRARMALSAMVPLIKQIRKEISAKRRELKAMKKQTEQ